MSEQEPQPTPPAPAPATRTVAGHFVDGVVRPVEPLDLPAGTPLTIIVPAAPAPATPAPPAGRGPLASLGRGEALALAGCLALYLATRLVDLAAFPIYFFCDEAIQAVLARDLLANGLRDAGGVWLPPYFLNAEKWSLSLSVYLQAASIWLFGSSLWLTRATSVAVSLLAPLGVAAYLRYGLRSPSWWLGPLALCAMPAWLIHSRTAFETVLMVACYACFLAAYLAYRLRDDRWAAPAIALGAATFYSYVNGQGVMLVSGALLLLLDLRYHLGRPLRRKLEAIAALGLSLVPLLRFRLLQPEAAAAHLRVLDSYWMRPIPLEEKLARFGEIYLTGLSPGYWFLPNDVDIIRHRMPDAGHLPLLLLPLGLLGAVVCLRQLRSPAHRVVIVAALAAPFASALVGLAVTRALAMVIPAALLAAIGLDAARAWIAPRWRQVASAAAALLLALSSVATTRAALTSGPTWFGDYGLSGMQYGAEQIFAAAAPELLAADPAARLLISPTWANNPNSFVDFFLTPAQRARVQLINVDAFINARRDLDPARDIFIMPPDEYERAQQSGKFTLQPPERVIPYPDGRPGFYVVRLAYVANIDELLAADRVARAALIETPLTIGDRPLTVAHSLLDIGKVADLFDGNPATLARGFEANPLVIELRFPEPRPLVGLDLTVGSMDLDLRVVATPAAGAPVELREQYRGLPPDPTVSLDLPAPLLVSALRLEITQVGVGEVAHVHVREIGLR